MTNSIISNLQFYKMISRVFSDFVLKLSTFVKNEKVS